MSRGSADFGRRLERNATDHRVASGLPRSCPVHSCPARLTERISWGAPYSPGPSAGYGRWATLFFHRCAPARTTTALDSPDATLEAANPPVRFARGRLGPLR